MSNSVSHFAFISWRPFVKKSFLFTHTFILSLCNNRLYFWLQCAIIHYHISLFPGFWIILTCHHHFWTWLLSDSTIYFRISSFPSPDLEIGFTLVTDFIFLGFKITVDSDCRLKIKRPLLFQRKFITNLNSILKSRDISLLTKLHIVKAMGFSSGHVRMWELDH